MTLRHTATGTLVAVALTFGGAAVAEATPGPSPDRFEVPCPAMQHRLDQTEHQLAHLAERQAKLEERRAAAVTASDDRRVARLDAQLARVGRLQERVTTLATRLTEALATHCAVEPEPTS